MWKTIRCTQEEYGTNFHSYENTRNVFLSLRMANAGFQTCCCMCGIFNEWRQILWKFSINPWTLLADMSLSQTTVLQALLCVYILLQTVYVCVSVCLCVHTASIHGHWYPEGPGHLPRLSRWHGTEGTLRWCLAANHEQGLYVYGIRFNYFSVLFKWHLWYVLCL